MLVQMVRTHGLSGTLDVSDRVLFIVTVFVSDMLHAILKLIQVVPVQDFLNTMRCRISFVESLINTDFA